MPKLSAKRQITLPITDCNALGIHAGDDVEIFRHGNQINIIKKTRNAAAGILKNTVANTSLTDAQSLQGQFE
jgi:bifunctional DNA-binding transcriptional regulator/antitoxin component of YhaV-PrlF toxin-antitoxin module